MRVVKQVGQGGERVANNNKKVANSNELVELKRSFKIKQQIWKNIKHIITDPSLR